MRRGTTHITGGVISKPVDGFPNWQGWCECGWKSVKHHQQSCAEAEMYQHMRKRMLTLTPEDPQ